MLRDPLLHFLVIGGLLFVLFRWVGDEPVATDEIVVTPGRVEQLVTSFRLVWQREPTEKEKAGLIEDWIREEVLCREAVALGLDQDDHIIREHLRQKLEFLAGDLSTQIEPTEEDLRAWLEEHGESYRIEDLFSFEQVYFDPDRRGDHLERDVRNVLKELADGSDGADPGALGDPILLPVAYTAMPATRVQLTFGTSFVAALRELTPGTWAGPGRSPPTRSARSPRCGCSIARIR